MILKQPFNLSKKCTRVFRTGIVKKLCIYILKYRYLSIILITQDDLPITT